jgi:methyl coenzyme M reductase subunit D
MEKRKIGKKNEKNNFRIKIDKFRIEIWEQNLSVEIQKIQKLCDKYIQYSNSYAKNFGNKIRDKI